YHYPAEACYRVRRVPGRIDEDRPQVGRDRGDSSGGGCARPRYRWRHELADLVLHSYCGKAVLSRVRQFEIADATRRLLHESRDPLAALIAAAGRPIHGSPGPNLRLPIGT